MLQRLDMTQLCSLLIFSLNKKNWKMVPICNVELAAVRKKGADVCGWVLWGSPCWQVIRQNTSLLHFPKHIINQRDISGCSHCCSQWSNISRNVMVDLRVWKIQVEVNWTPYTICAYEKDKKKYICYLFHLHLWLPPKKSLRHYRNNNEKREESRTWYFLPGLFSH